MKVTYDSEVDALSIVLSDAPVEESDEEKPADAPFEARLRGHIEAVIRKIADPRLRPLHRI